jgi:hypothetical protein
VNIKLRGDGFNRDGFKLVSFHNCRDFAIRGRNCIEALVVLTLQTKEIYLAVLKFPSYTFL